MTAGFGAAVFSDAFWRYHLVAGTSVAGGLIDVGWPAMALGDGLLGVAAATPADRLI